MSQPTIVIVEDDAPIAELVAFNLNSEGYATRSFGDGASMLAALPQLQPVALFVLDVMLPGIDGFEILRRLKADPASAAIPVIMLTARGTEADKVHGLMTGADDYLAKPFGIREFLARVASVLRRAGMAGSADTLRRAGMAGSADTLRRAGSDGGADSLRESGMNGDAGTLRQAGMAGSAVAPGKSDGQQPAVAESAGPIVLDDARHRVYREGHEVEMTHREYELLKYLMQHRGIAFSRDELLNAVWGFDYYGETRTVDVHIRQLRRKLEADDANPTLIETVRGRGYRFTDRFSEADRSAGGAGRSDGAASRSAGGGA